MPAQAYAVPVLFQDLRQEEALVCSCAVVVPQRLTAILLTPPWCAAANVRLAAIS